MTRTIDADLLIEQTKEMFCKRKCPVPDNDPYCNPNCAARLFINIIANAPTVELTEPETHIIVGMTNDVIKAIPVLERPKGEWEEIESSSDIGHRFYHCSVCNRFLDVMTADGETLEDYPFCHCGADMRKQSEGDDNGKA